MSIKESALNAITSITQSDFIRAVTAAGASRRVTVANLAKAIIESYTGSSLAGSDRSVKAALDKLANSFQNYQRTIAAGEDYTFPMTTGYHALVCAANTNTILYLTGNPGSEVLYQNGEATGFTITNTGTTIKVHRDNGALFSISVLIF